MSGFRFGQVTLLMALIVTISVGCAASRSGGCRDGSCRASSAADSLPPRRNEAMQAGVVDKAPPGRAQQNCPVTGEMLGSMGPPIPVSVKGRTIQVCCDGCVAAVRKEPDKYLKIVDDELSRPKIPAIQNASVGDRTPVIGSDVPASGAHHH